jgi:hypothetical protein
MVVGIYESTDRIGSHYENNLILMYTCFCSLYGSCSDCQLDRLHQADNITIIYDISMKP